MTEKIRSGIEIKGIVQGVGFRPWIHKLAEQYDLAGWVCNTSDGALLEIEGREEAVAGFISSLREDPPALALIETIRVTRYETPTGYVDFTIRESRSTGKRNTLLAPDICTCSDCLKELFDKNDRRYRYPFINCTNCGPRFTIIKDLPYDRARTTMDVFPMCEACAAEFTDIDDRRYHAQPDCCEACGPKLMFLENNVRTHGNDASIRAAANALKQGKIVAIKGLGGFHLACTVDDAQLIEKLRNRKHRDQKPFAIMCADLEAAGKYAQIGPDEERILTGKERPIVLLKKKPGAVLNAISENAYIGILLPFTPVQFLLFSEGFDALVMTSANISDEPVISGNEEALEKLSGIADAFLLNDREIHVKCDDSLVQVYNGRPYFMRRSRGYVPIPLDIEALKAVRKNASPCPQVLACGAELKASFAACRDGHAFLSQHIGDLKNIATLHNYEAQISHFLHMFDIKPDVLVCDSHPDYLSAKYARKKAASEGLQFIQVQHHYAHMASCMADNSLQGPCIGIIWDGTGYGDDGTTWGSEFLYGDFEGFERKGSIRPIRLPGGDRCMKEIRRTALSLLDDAGIAATIEPSDSRSDQDEVILRMLNAGLNCPESSGMGRLFDGVSYLLGICEENAYEGRGAMLLEAAAVPDTDDFWPVELYEDDGICRYDYRPMIRKIMKESDNGAPAGYLAAKFMNTLVRMAVNMCIIIGRETGCADVVLSGGTFQNMYLLERLVKALADTGFTVYTHKRVSTNDEGIALGQAVIGIKRYVSCNTFENN